MKLKQISKVGLIVAVFLILVFFIANKFGFIDSKVIEFKLNNIIESKNYSLMKSVSADDSTYEYIKSLPNGTKFVNVTDFQGVVDEKYYYVATLNNEPVDVFVTSSDNSNLLYRLYPQLTIYKIKVRLSK